MLIMGFYVYKGFPKNVVPKKQQQKNKKYITPNTMNT